MALQGAREHTFTNPHGIVYRIELFREAVGCALEDEAIQAWTWFPGYAWQIGTCRGCRIHLGWGFRAVAGAAPASFYGLIRDRLLEG